MPHPVVLCMMYDLHYVDVSTCHVAGIARKESEKNNSSGSI